MRTLIVLAILAAGGYYFFYYKKGSIASSAPLTSSNGAVSASTPSMTAAQRLNKMIANLPVQTTDNSTAPASTIDNLFKTMPINTPPDQTIVQQQIQMTTGDVPTGKSLAGKNLSTNIYE